jgi:hypothetical protein
MPLKIPRKMRKRFDQTSDEPIRRERISASRTRIVGINHGDADDPYRSGYLDGLRRARSGQPVIVEQHPALADAIANAKGIRIDDILHLLKRWCSENHDLVNDAYHRHVTEIRRNLLDIQESEPPAKGTTFSDLQ